MNEKKLIKLSGFGWKAEIAPFYGMNTLRLTANGRPILRAPETMELVSSGSATYGNAVLFPPNRTAGAKFTFDGQCYCLPLNEPRYHNNIHGRLHQATFHVLDRTPHSVTATYLNLGEVFPFPFRITVSYHLDETGYHQTFALENTGSTDMPLHFGLHTNLVAPEMLRIPLASKWLKNDRLFPSGESIALNEQELRFCEGSPCQGFPIAGFFTSSGSTVQLDNILYTVSGNFKEWILWNGEGNKGFVTVGPMSGAVNCLNSGVGLLRLAPGQKEIFRVWFHLSDS